MTGERITDTGRAVRADRATSADRSSDAAELAGLLHGPARRRHRERLAPVFQGPAFTTADPGAVPDRQAAAYRRLRLVNTHVAEGDLYDDLPAMTALNEFAVLADPPTAGVLVVHYGLSLPMFAADRFRPGTAGLVSELRALDAVAVYLISEVGCGASGALHLKTEAVYDAERDELVLRTPDASAHKIMANLALGGIPRIGVVQARLRIGAEDHGIVPIAVRLRDREGAVPGVEISTLSDQPAFAWDGARVALTGVRVPAGCLLAHDRSVRELAAAPPADPQSQLAIAMASVPRLRLALAETSLAAARAAVAIGADYAAHRALPTGNGPGEALLGLANMRRVLGGSLARVSALTAWATDLRDRLAAGTDPVATAEGISLLKGVSTHDCYAILGEMRQRCGARGLLAENKLADLLAWCDAMRTGGGDSDAILAGIARAGLARTPVPTPTAAPEPGLEAAEPVPLSERPDYRGLLRLLQRREEERFGQVLMRLAVTPAAVAGLPFRRWAAVLDEAIAAARASAARSAMEALLTRAERAGSPRVAALLRESARRFALEEVADDLGWLMSHGLVAPDTGRLVPDLRSASDDALLADLPLLVAAFDLPAALMPVPALGLPPEARATQTTSTTYPTPKGGPMSDADFRLDGKAALITGASRGIGRAIALGFARQGANLALLARTARDLDEVSDLAQQHGVKAVPIPCDLADLDALDRAFAQALETFGDLDILVNNAGLLGSAGPFLSLTTEDWHRLTRVNFDAPVRLLRHFGRHAVARGSGSVLNMSSVAGANGVPMISHYGAAKAALESVSRTVAAEWAASGVRVNILSPGWITTALTVPFAADPDVAAGLLRAVPDGRWGAPEDVVGAAVWLAGDAARMVTGARLTIDGGMTCYNGGPTMVDLLALGRIDA